MCTFRMLTCTWIVQAIPLELGPVGTHRDEDPDLIGQTQDRAAASTIVATRSSKELA